MNKRSITDAEVGLIKAMLARGMANKDIQFFFNRPERSVNSGRITGIAKGIYPKECASIPRATDAELDAYLASASAAGAVSAVIVPSAAPSPPIPLGPVDPEAIARLFLQDAAGVWRLVAGETDQHECKANFGWTHSGAWLKAVAALANNRGGYVLFGVNDKDEHATAEKDDSYAVIGLQSDLFAKADPAEFAKRIKSVLDPTPRVQIAVATIGGCQIGVLHVEQHPSRPVIVTRPEARLQEGDIFYRYPGQSNRIKYSDLRAMLDERDAQARRDVLPLVERLLALGPRRALIADLDAGVLDDGKQQILIDEKLVKEINFIREGEFEELSGAPTLKLVGEVRPTTGRIPGTGGRGLITDTNVLGNFLDQITVVEPVEYIRFAVDQSSRDWLPLYYFARAAGLDRPGLVDAIRSTPTTRRTRRKEALLRAVGKRRAFSRQIGTPGKILKGLLAGEIPDPSDAKSAAQIASAVQGIPDAGGPSLERLLRLVKACRDVLLNAEAFSQLSHVYRAAARVDELHFDFRDRADSHVESPSDERLPEIDLLAVAVPVAEEA